MKTPTKALLIDVTEKLIKRARRNIVPGSVDACRCPVALAVCEAAGLKPGHTISVSQFAMVIHRRDENLVEGPYQLQADTPGPFADFMSEFDAGRPVEPIKLRVEFKREPL